MKQTTRLLSLGLTLGVAAGAGAASMLAAGTDPGVYRPATTNGRGTLSGTSHVVRGTVGGPQPIGVMTGSGHVVRAGAGIMELDADNDGYVGALDCGPTDPSIYDGAPETVDDGIDQDCNGFDTVTCFVDTDRDGYGSTATQLAADGDCSDAGESAVDTDCNDTAAGINPGAVEVCDAGDTDEDCNNLADDADPGATGKALHYADADRDGYGSASDTGAAYCDPPAGLVLDHTDCNDANATCNTDCTDTDNDGACDPHDNCASVANANQTDTDGDGIGDACDPDIDADGHANAADNCPDVANIDQADHDADGAGDACDPDDDNDGVLDLVDLCPLGEIGWTDLDNDGDGCRDLTEDADQDNDGTLDVNDGCPTDPSKIVPGACGCGTADTDADADGTPDCNDGCRADPNKTAPGACGCGTPDIDSDADGTLDCDDGCPDDPAKTAPGACGCGNAETDSDSDATPDCMDGCPNDATKTEPGACGCGVAESTADSDSDGTVDCIDGCPTDAGKTAAGLCGCGVAETDGDSDTTPDCIDGCPTDSAKVEPGACGCSVAETDTDGDLVPDCADNCPALGNPGQADHDGDLAGDLCDGDDDDDGVINELDACRLGAIGLLTSLTDYDGDGCSDASEDPDDDNDTHLDGSDCDPVNETVYPGAPEVPDDGIDQDCDGIDSVAVPDVVGTSEADAATAITVAGLVAGTTTSTVSETVAVGLIGAQSPAAGMVVLPGTAVDLAVVVNRLPVVEPLPAVTVATSGCLAVPVVASDPDGHVLAYSLPTAPAGMEVSSRGLVTWFPGGGDIGSHAVVVQVDDGAGGVVSETLDVTVEATGADLLPPIASIWAPARVAAASGFDVVVRASDDVGVASVRLLRNGAELGLLTSAPYLFTTNAPDSAGVLHLDAISVDAAGNEARAVATVVVESGSDTTPPVVDAVRVPSQAGRDEVILAIAEVSDDWGVIEVSFSVDGLERARLSAPPFAASLQMPEFTESAVVEVTAVDAAGNSTRSEVTVPLVVDHDTVAPSSLTLSAPETAVAGSTASLSATATDAVGVAKVVFSRSGALIAESAAPPYSAALALSPTLPPGTAVRFEARAFDFSGNESPPQARCVATLEAVDGVLLVGVFDDTTGKPLEAATVALAGGLLTASTDAQGQAALSAAPGSAHLSVFATGYTPASRKAVSLAGAASRVLDARLTPLAPAEPVPSDVTAGIGALDDAIWLEIPAGALEGTPDVALTPLSSQGLPGPLPLGWRPITVASMTPDGVAAFDTLSLTFTSGALGVAAGDLSRVVAAQWDAGEYLWRRVEHLVVTGTASVLASTDETGTLALLHPDTLPEAPPLPALGEALQGVAAGVIPVDAAAMLLPTPQIIVGRDGGHSRVVARLDASVSSGTPVRIDINQSYTLVDGRHLMPPVMTQTLMLYQQPDGIESRFVVSPTAAFETSSLEQGEILLTANRHQADALEGVALVGPGGGTVTSSDGIFLAVPAGALSSTRAVRVAHAPLENALLDPDSRLEVLAAVDVDSGAGELGSGASLGVELATPIDPAAQVLVLRTVDVAGEAMLELVGVAEIFGAELSVDPGLLGLPFDSVRGTGRYWLARALEPVGFVTGNVTDATATVNWALVQTDDLPLVSQVESGSPAYVVAATLSTVGLSAVELGSGHTGHDSIVLATEGETVTRDLPLAAAPPTVVAVSPHYEATGVPLASVVTLTFSAAMDPATIDSSSVFLEAGGVPVSATVILLDGGTGAVIRPAALLAESSVHDVVVTAAAVDIYGQPLSGGEPDGSFRSAFTTLDITPPSKPAAGALSMTIPADSGSGSQTTVSGGAGAAEPNGLVILTNETTGQTTTVSATGDGSFSAVVGAIATDEITVTLQDASGNETLVDPGPFRNADGSTIVNSGGGEVKGPDGLLLRVPIGAVPDGSILRISDVAAIDVVAGLPPGFVFVRGFDIETNGVVASRPLEVSFPLPDVNPPAESDTILVFSETNAAGIPLMQIVDKAEVAGTRIETASDGFASIRSTGRYVTASSPSPQDLANASAASYAGGTWVRVTDTSTGLDILALARGGVILSCSGPTCTITVLDETGGLLGSAMDPVTIPGSGGLSFVHLAAPKVSVEPFGIVGSVPSHHATDVRVDIQPRFGLSEPLLADGPDAVRNCTPEENNGVVTPDAFNCICVHRCGHLGCLPGEVTVEDGPDGLQRVLAFLPYRFLRLDECYVADVGGIRAATDGAEIIQTGDHQIEFKTVPVRVFAELGMADPAYPGGNDPRDIAVADDGLLILSTGREDFGRHPYQGYYGLSLVDVTEPAAPLVAATAGSGTATRVIEPIPNAGEFLTFSATLDTMNFVKHKHYSVSGPAAEIYPGVLGYRRITTIRDERLLSDNLQVMLPGLFGAPGGIVWAPDTDPTTSDLYPPWGWELWYGYPVALALGEDGSSVYASIIGIGTIYTTTGEIAMLARSEKPVSFPSEEERRNSPGSEIHLAVDTLFDRVVLGTPDEIMVLDKELSKVEATLAAGGRALKAVTGFEVEVREVVNGTIEETVGPRAIVFALDVQGDSTALVAVDMAYDLRFPHNPAVAAWIPLPFPSTGKDLAVDVQRRVAYVTTDKGLVLVDVRLSREVGVSPWLGLVDDDGDGEDDRILGLSRGMYAAGPIAISPDGAHVYVGDRGNEALYVIGTGVEGGDGTPSLPDRITPLEPPINPDLYAERDTGDPVNPFNGEFLTTETDIAIPGRGLSFAFTRTYRSQSLYDGPLGYGWDHNYNERLELEFLPPSLGGTMTHAMYRSGGGRTEKFRAHPSGNRFYAPPGVLAELELITEPPHDPDKGNYRIRDAAGVVKVFEPSGAEPWTYRLKRITDRYGNSMAFAYTSGFEIDTVTDSMGRTIQFAYAGGRIDSITDFGGRAVQYDYDVNGDLWRVTKPATRSVSSNVTAYTYSSGFDQPHLNHNLLSITDPNGQTYLTNAYYPALDRSDITFDRVQAQTMGCAGAGGTYNFTYRRENGQVVATTDNRGGAKTTRYYDWQGHVEKLVVHTSDEGDLTTLSRYTRDGLVRHTESPSGIAKTYWYDTDNNDPTRRGDLVYSRVVGKGGELVHDSEYQLGAFGRPTSIKQHENGELKWETAFQVNDRGDVTKATRPTTGDNAAVVETWVYLPSGLLDHHINQYGGRTEYRYEVAADGQLGYLESVTRVGIGTTSYEYDIYGNRTKETDVRGQETRLTVNALNQIEHRSTWRGTEQYTYDGNGSVTQIHTVYTDGTPDLLVDQVFDCLGRMTSKTETAGGLTRTLGFAYDENEDLASETTARGHRRVYTYDERGLRTSVAWTGEGPAARPGLVEELKYDAEGNLEARIVDPNGTESTTTHFWDGLNRAKRVVDPDGNSVWWEHNVNGKVTRESRYDSLGTRVKDVKTTWDGADRLLETREKILPEGDEYVVAVRYESRTPAGQRITRTDSLGRVSVIELDQWGRAVREQDPEGNAVDYTYSGPDLDFKTLTSVRSNGPGATVTDIDYVWDTHGRLTSETLAHGTADARVTTYTYDVRDQVLTRTETGGLTVVSTYDGFGHLKTTTKGREVATYGYDLDDNVTSITDAKSDALARSYDGRGRLDVETYADGTMRGLQYRNDDLVDTITDRAGNTLKHSYTPGGLLESVSVEGLPAHGFLEGATERRFAYDGLHRILTAESIGPSWSHATTFSYDWRGSLLSQTTDGLGVQSTYNAAGDRLTAVAVGVAGLEGLHFTRDDLGRASTIARYQTGSPAGSIVDYGFLGADRIESATYANGTESIRTFTAAREEKERRFNVTASQALLTGFEYGRTAAGRVTGVARLHEGGVGDAYRYSPGEQWVEEVVRGVASPLDATAVDAAIAASAYDEHITFTHDAASNWTSRTTNGAAETFTPNSLNQYASIGGQTYTYDDNGNLRSNGQHDFVFDVFGELIRVEDATTGALVAEYEYDAFGNVAARRTQTETEKYVYDGSFVVAILDASDTPQQQVVFNDAAVDIPVLLRIADGTGGFNEYFYQRDGIGSVKALTDSSGSVVERYEYDAYGRVTITDAGGTERSASAYGNRLMFASRPQDPATGLINMRARWYSPDIGRFLSPDPAGLVDGTNLYAYASNDPLNFFDPSGLARQATQDNPGLGTVGVPEPWPMRLLNKIVGTRTVHAGRGPFLGMPTSPTGRPPWMPQPSNSAAAAARATQARRIIAEIRKHRPGYRYQKLSSERGTTRQDIISLQAEWIRTIENFPLRTTGSGRPTGRYFNLIPEDTPQPVMRFRLAERDGKWVTISETGTARTASGRYIFVRQGDNLYVSKGGGHIDIARGGRVDYAGEVEFSGRTNRGRVKSWTNASGHYRPDAASAELAGLPMEQFAGK